MVVVAQSVRASDCGSEGRGFESHLPPKKTFQVFITWKVFFSLQLAVFSTKSLVQICIAQCFNILDAYS